MATRYFASFGLGIVITLVLFFVMQAVIATDEARLDEGAKGKLLDFVRLEEDQEALGTGAREPRRRAAPAADERAASPRPGRRLQLIVHR